MDDPRRRDAWTEDEKMEDALKRVRRRALSSHDDEDGPPFIFDQTAMLRLPTVAHGRRSLATFGMGAFWDAEAQFGIIDGVVCTRVGYACGTTSRPSTYNVGDHAEVVQVEYDPQMCRYEDLLKMFWLSHDATAPQLVQHSSLVLVHDQRQRRAAEAFISRQQSMILARVRTMVLPYGVMYQAEIDQQKHFLQQHTLVRAFQHMSHEGFITSERATRANGFLGGFGTTRALTLIVRRMRLTKSQEVDFTEGATRAMSTRLRTLT